MIFAGNAGNVLVAQLVNGVSLGAVLALLSLGFNGIMAVGRAVHFAFPTAVVFSMYGRWAIEAAGGLPSPPRPLLFLLALQSPPRSVRFSIASGRAGRISTCPW